MQDWIPRELQTGNVEVVCKTCDSEAELNDRRMVYECDCHFGAPVEALAFGLPGYKWVYDG